MKNNKVTVSFVSLGCFKNLVDTEVLGGFLQKRGMEVVSSYETSDWIIINTCGFIRDAKEESIDEIFSALEKKEKGETQHVAVLGCLPQRYYEDIKGSFKNVDILWGVNDMEELADLISQNKRAPYQDRQLFLYSDRHHRIITTTPNVGYLKMAEGCNMTCSFCAIPQIRGPYRSRPINSIINEAVTLKERGVEEINLISQNSTFYGKDRSSQSQLPKLIKELAGLGFEWIRVLYLMPEEVNQSIIEAFSHSSVLPYFDLPFQHVSPKILKKMNRGGGFTTNLDLVHKIRDRFSQAVIRSTFIVGFPGETSADFSLLAQFARQAAIERIGVFAFSAEEGTDAFSLKNENSQEAINQRREVILDISDENMAAYNKSQLHTTHRFLPLGPCPWDEDKTIGRIESQAPDVDGLCILNRKFSGQYNTVKMKLVDYKNELLFGDQT